MGETHVIPVSNGLLEPKHITAIGPAIWVYLWMVDRVTKNEEGEGLVLGGTPIRFQAIAESLGMRSRTVWDHIMILCDGGYVRREGPGKGPFGYYITKNKKWKRAEKHCAIPQSNCDKSHSLGEISQSVGELPQSYCEIPQSYIRKDNTETIQNNTETEDLSVLSRVLCESIGCFDLREQGAIHQLLSSHARHTKKPLEAATNHIISRWNEYQKAAEDGLISYPYGSAYKFLMSGKWDNPNTWNWKGNNGYQSKPGISSEELRQALGR